MAMPPKDADPSKLWIRYSERPRQTCDFEMPGKGKDGKPIGTAKFWVLTEYELDFCRAKADQTAREFMGAAAPKNGEISFGYEDIYRNELMVQLVAIACRDFENEKYPVFISANDARKTLTTDELAVIVRGYNNFRVECGPVVSELTQPELNAWVNVLKQGGSRLPLARLTSEALSDLVMHLIAMVSQPMPNGSVGSQLENSSTKLPVTKETDEPEV